MSNTVCFFGATGGVTNACLTATLKSGEYNAIAMVRTPEKLRNQLKDLQGLDDATIDSHLSIVKGDSTSVEDVQAALLTNVSSKKDDKLPFMIVSGLGGTPHLKFEICNPLQFVEVDNPTICESSAQGLLTALKNIYAETPELATNKPGVAFVSTTGVSKEVEDVPIAMRYLYHQILGKPHQDKRKMEDVFRDNLNGSDPLVVSATGIRPTLLMGTGALKESIGIDKIRVGVEKAPETGYTVQRADVGIWVFEKIVKGADDGKWRSEMVSLTS